MSRRPRIALLAGLALATLTFAHRPAALAAAPQPETDAMVSVAAAEPAIHAGWDARPALDQSLWGDAAELVDQTRGSVCDDLSPLIGRTGVNQTRFVMADAPASPHICVFTNAASDQYGLWSINTASIEEFRRYKQAALSLLDGAGIDRCLVSYVIPTSDAVGKASDMNDWHDVDRPCAPIVLTHGPRTDPRKGEITTLLNDAMANAEGMFGWKLTWPLHIHAFDDHPAYTAGLISMGEQGPNHDSEAGVAWVSAVRVPLIVLDVSRFPSPSDLRVLVTHEYTHIVEHGVTGCACTLPIFVAEGGADFVASLLAGPDQRHLASVFQGARQDEMTGHAPSLSSLIKDDDSTDPFAPYTRGYAAMLFIADRWGLDAFVRLMAENHGGTPFRYLENLTRVTGLSLEGFDTALNSWLHSHAPYAAPLQDGATLAPGSSLIRVATSRADASDARETSAFGAADSAVTIRMEWDCHERQERGEAHIYAPGGRDYATFGGMIDKGCTAETEVSLKLDDGRGGVSPRSLPGEWRVELTMGGVLQGTVVFTIGG